MLSSPKDRCSPEMIVIMQESNMARVRWFFPDMISRDISYFRVSVKKDHCDDEIFSKNVAAVDRSCTVGNILPRMGYTVTVETIYNDGISRKRYVRYNDFGKSIDTRTAFSALIILHTITIINGKHTVYMIISRFISLKYIFSTLYSWFLQGIYLYWKGTVSVIL